MEPSNSLLLIAANWINMYLSDVVSKHIWCNRCITLMAYSGKQRSSSSTAITTFSNISLLSDRTLVNWKRLLRTISKVSFNDWFLSKSFDIAGTLSAAIAFFPDSKNSLKPIPNLFVKIVDITSAKNFNAICILSFLFVSEILSCNWFSLSIITESIATSGSS